MAYADNDYAEGGSRGLLRRFMGPFAGRAGMVFGAHGAGVLLMSTFAQVEPGNVGIRVNNIAGGVSPRPLGVGWYFAPPGAKIYEYPVFTRTYSWTSSTTEQSPLDESFGFQDKNGLSLKADVAVSYHVDPSKAPILFQRYRTDMDQIISGPLRNAIRNAIVERAAQLGVEQIYGRN